MSTDTAQRPVLVVDFGAQYAQLIARRVREAGVFSELVSHNITAEEVAAKNPVAIILSGGPSSVYAEGAPEFDTSIFGLKIEVSNSGAPSAYTELGPPERMIATGFFAATSSAVMLCGTSSLNTPASRTRRAISWAYCAPKSTTRTGRCAVSVLTGRPPEGDRWERG